MDLPDTIKELSNGARFVRGDLHIHSFSASHDVKDATMTPTNIVATCVAEKLGVIAVTDHNEITNVAATVEAGKAAGLHVIPGVELSTSDGHLLVYLPTVSDLEAFYGKLNVAGRHSELSRCQTSLLECLNLAEAHGGFAILAHVDIADGFEARMPGAPPQKRDIICHPGLLGIEVKSPNCGITYDDQDIDAQRVGLARERRAALTTGPGVALARVLSSDSHALANLGRNAAGAQRLTRFKMDSPSFDALRIALRDAEARVRLEDEIPASVPRIEAAVLSGGFLDKTTVRFSPNLTCIIGGRGAGKSTLFECVRILAQQESAKSVVDSDAWPDHLQLWWRDEAGSVDEIVRDKETESINSDNPFGLIRFPIQSYGQSETAEASSKAQSDPSQLLHYLDQFVEFDDLLVRDETIRSSLLNNQSAIEGLLRETAALPSREQQLATTRKQIAALDAEKGGEILTLERKVADEARHRTVIEESLERLAIDYRAVGTSDHLDAILASAAPGEKVIGVDQCAKIVEAATALAGDLKATGTSLAARVKQFSDAVRAEIATWKTQEREERVKIEAIRVRLAANGVKLDVAFIRKLAADEAGHQTQIKRLKEKQKDLADNWKARKLLLDQRRAVLSEIQTKRTAFAVQASRFLAKSLTDLTVSVKFGEHNLSLDAERIVQTALGWRTVQVPRAGLLVEVLGIPGLLRAIARNEANTIAAIKDHAGAAVFSMSEAQNIIDRLKLDEHRFQLESCIVDDRPRIAVTKAVEVGATTKPITRDFSRLSLGQQQSVLLSIMLANDRTTPLLIDQPEDNLDSEFIYSSLVPILRRVKERRQVIVVTHNANIAILGDAEMVVALKGLSDRGLVIASGSIDADPVRKAACHILEGTKEAFLRRARVYGHV